MCRAVASANVLDLLSSTFRRELATDGKSSKGHIAANSTTGHPLVVIDALARCMNKKPTHHFQLPGSNCQN